LKIASLEAMIPQISLAGEKGFGSVIILYLQGFDLSNPELFFIILKGGLDKSSPYIILIKPILYINQAPT